MTTSLRPHKTSQRPQRRPARRRPGPRRRPTRPAPTPAAVAGRARRRPRQGATASEVLRGMGIAFTVAVLLGSGALVDLASQQPYGAQRDVAVTAARSVDRLAHFLSLNRPVDQAEAWLGRTPPPAVDVEALVDGQRAAPPTTASTVPLDVNPATGRRWVTADAPLRVLLVGDSMMRELGAGVEDSVPGGLATTVVDYRVSSGLARPDYFDWPSHLALLADAQRPEAVVLWFGTNDYQDVATGGAVVEAGSDAWLAEYGRRVGLVMDLFDRPGVTVFWVTQPPMRASAFGAAMERLNAVYRAEAQARPWVDVVELGPPLSGEDGGYAAYLDDGSGPELMRQDDGIHLSRAGARRAAAAVWSAIELRWLR